MISICRFSTEWYWEIYHGIDQTLVAITQVGGEPARGLVNGFVWPLPVWKMKRRKPLVFLGGVFEPSVSYQLQ
jgi:hypothetical protein